MKIVALFDMYNVETRQYFRQGVTYDVPEDLAREYIAAGHAEPAEEKARAEPTPEKPKGRPKKTV